MATGIRDSVAEKGKEVTTAVQALDLTPAIQRSEKLLRAAREGDEWAFEEMLRLHRAPVYRLALGMLKEPEAAADVSQEVFIRFFKSLRRLRASRGIGAWLRKVTIHRCYDELRSRKRTRQLKEELLPACMQTDIEFDQKMVAEWLQKSLEMLTPRERAALVLTCHQGYSSKEASKAMGCTASTVRVLCFKARGKLKAVLAPGQDNWRR